MPTADAYWRAAADFARLAEEMTAEAVAVRRALTDTIVVGGRLRPTLDESVEMIVSGAGATADAYDVLAAECRRRALACEAYTAALRAHERSVAAWEASEPHRAGGVPTPPRRDPWMTPG